LPPLGEQLVAAPTEQQGLGAQRLVALDVGPRLEVLAPELVEPAAQIGAVLTVRVLNDPVERGVRTDDDLSRCLLPVVVSVATEVDTSTR